MTNLLVASRDVPSRHLKVRNFSRTLFFTKTVGEKGSGIDVFENGIIRS
jgi:hypothetical protein